MRKFNVFQAIPLSFGSKDLYRDVGQHWVGISYFYLLLLLAMAWLPTIYASHGSMTEWLEGDGQAYIQQIPDISIKDGQLSSDAPQPYYLRHPESGVEVAILDTTGAITSLEGTKAALLVTADSIIVKKRGGYETYDLGAAGDLEFTSEIAKLWSEKFSFWGIIFGYFFIVFASYIYRVVQCCIYAAIGILIKDYQKVKLEYSALVSLSMMAVTPVIVIGTFMDLLNLTLPFAPVFAFALSMSLLWYSIKANKDVKKDSTLSTTSGDEPLLMR